MLFHFPQLEPWGGLSTAISGTMVLGRARAARCRPAGGAGMCCCYCGCCPLLDHLEQGSLGERVSVDRWKARTRDLGSKWAVVQGGKGLLGPFLAPVPWPLPVELSREVIQRGNAVW